jgi:hypothetical protein
MYVQRRPASPPARRGSNLPMVACGCMATLVAMSVLAVVALYLLLPRLPNVAAQVAGLSERGQTDAVFQAVTPAPVVPLQNAVQPEQVTVDLGSYGGAQTLSESSAYAPYYDVQVGSDPVGRQTAVVSFTEDGLLELCRQRSDVCSGANPQFQNPRIDLRPGGAVIYADVSVPTQYGFTVQQTAGVVLQLDPSQRQFQFAGVDLNGTLYDAPPNEFASQIQQFENTGNDLLNQLTVNAGAGQLALSQVSIDDSTLTLVLQ